MHEQSIGDFEDNKPKLIVKLNKSTTIISFITENASKDEAIQLFKMANKALKKAGMNIKLPIDKMVSINEC